MTDQGPFRARLTPHRSLSPRGFLILMSIIGLVSFVGGLVFLIIGAWPVVGFLGLDAFLIWWAFRLNYGAARMAEEVVVSSEEIVIRRISKRGTVNECRFNPYWARLKIQRCEDRGVTRLAVTSHGREVEIGRFLNPVDRESFFLTFSKALESARGMKPVETG